MSAQSDRDVALVAEIERSTDWHITKVEHKTFLPLANGTCGECGVPIRFLNIMLCEDCLPPPARCQVCDGAADCYSQGKGHMCAEHARSEWGWG